MRATPDIGYVPGANSKDPHEVDEGVGTMSPASTRKAPTPCPDSTSPSSDLEAEPDLQGTPESGSAASRTHQLYRLLFKAELCATEPVHISGRPIAGSMGRECVWVSERQALCVPPQTGKRITASEDRVLHQSGNEGPRVLATRMFARTARFASEPTHISMRR